MLDEGREIYGHKVHTITATWKGGDTPRQCTGNPIRVMNANGTLDYLRAHEAEKLMGLPEGHTNLPGASQAQRLKLIGNGMDVRCLRQMLQHFRVRDVPKAEHDTMPPPKWISTVTKDMGRQPLPVQDMAPWLAPGACPQALWASDWQHGMMHPEAVQVLRTAAWGADIRYEGPRTGTVECSNNPSWWAGIAPGVLGTMGSPHGPAFSPRLPHHTGIAVPMGTALEAQCGEPAWGLPGPLTVSFCLPVLKGSFAYILIQHHPVVQQP